MNFFSKYLEVVYFFLLFYIRTKTLFPLINKHIFSCFLIKNSNKQNMFAKKYSRLLLEKLNKTGLKLSLYVLFNSL